MVVLLLIINYQLLAIITIIIITISDVQALLLHMSERS